MTERQASGDLLNCRLPSGKPVTGTLLWYYAICKREVWLMAHNITPDEEHQSLEIGRVVHESFYTRMKKEIEAEGMKIDVVGGKNGLVYEVKTSSRFLEATKLQLGYYLLRLEQMGIKARGAIAIPRERRSFHVELNNELRELVLSALKEIFELCIKPLPPPAKWTRFCRRCAYRDFCWGVMG
ncbi:MAG: CRISPR-associated protein Cas4 [Candidatus Bathyarchaeia archaeon]